ncbi:MAG: proton-conducting transporter membrane subunit [Anaerolineales bacterium]|nr:proton-conducting transporter membrane subunit [Anaerolineales bacterium]
MPAPLLFILLPFAAAVAVYALRHRPWAEAGTAVGVAAFLALLALFLPLNAAPLLRDSFSLLGRTFIWQQADRLALGSVYGLSALIFLAAGLWPQGRFFLPAGVAALGLVAAALFVRPFLYAAIFIQLAAALGVFILADERHPLTAGPLRFLIYTSLGVPFVLFAAWLIDASVAAPEDPTLLPRATLLLGGGLALFMAVVPFHSWLPILASYSPPLATTFIVAVVRAPVIFLLLRLIETYPWLRREPAVFTALSGAGALMVVVGALFVFGQQNWGRSVGYALLIEIGATLLAVGLETHAGIVALLALFLMRGLSLLVWGAAVEQLRRVSASGEADFASLRGVGWRYPFAVTAAAMGLLSLMGLPLMAGFPAKWALLRLLAEQNALLALALLAAMTSVGVVVMRGLASLTTPASPDEVILPQETLLQIIFYSLSVLAILALGAFPQWLLPWVAASAAAFPSFR